MSDKIKAMQTMTLARAIDLINEQERRIAELEAELNQEISIDLVSGEVSRRPAAAPEVAAEQPAAEPELLPLPEPLCKLAVDESNNWVEAAQNGEPVFTADKMHSYARAHLSTQGSKELQALRARRDGSGLSDGQLWEIAYREGQQAGQGKDSELLDRLDAWRAIESKTGACWASMHFDLSKPVRGQIDAAIIKAADEIAAIEAREAAAKGEQQ